MILTREKFDNIVKCFYAYYSIDNITKISKENEDKYSDNEIKLLEMMANGYFKRYVLKRMRTYISKDYRFCKIFVKTLFIDLSNVSDAKQRMAFEVRNVVLDQLILIIDGEFEVNDEKDIDNKEV
jgi:hypothetical protein